MFERFADRARKVIVFAEREARSLGHAEIGPVHVLLGLLVEEEGMAARILENQSVSYDTARPEVERRLPPSSTRAPNQMLPVMPRAQRALDAAVRAAGNEEVRTEHVLLGLVRAMDEVTAEVLTALGTDPSRIWDETVQRLGGSIEVGEAAEPMRRWRWDYHVLRLGTADELSAERLNRLGSEGWELVSALDNAGQVVLILKRQAAM